MVKGDSLSITLLDRAVGPDPVKIRSYLPEFYPVKITSYLPDLDPDKNDRNPAPHPPASTKLSDNAIFRQFS